MGMNGIGLFSPLRSIPASAPYGTGAVPHENSGRNQQRKPAGFAKQGGQSEKDEYQCSTRRFFRVCAHKNRQNKNKLKISAGNTAVSLLTVEFSLVALEADARHTQTNQREGEQHFPVRCGRLVKSRAHCAQR